MKVLIIDGSEVFECETSYMKQKSKIEMESSIREIVFSIAKKFKEIDEPVLNTFKNDVLSKENK